MSFEAQNTSEERPLENNNQIVIEEDNIMEPSPPRETKLFAGVVDRQQMKETDFLQPMKSAPKSMKPELSFDAD